MSSTRAFALRRITAAPPRPILRPRAPPGPVASVGRARWESSKPDDLGGPGGQEPVPSSSGASQSWPTLAAIAAVGVGVGAYLVHLTGRRRGSVKPEGGPVEELAAKVTTPGK